MAVLPGATSNRPTPGGMPDSRQMSKVGPAPSMPKMGAGPAELGSVAGVPNPDDLVDLFTAYTSGQMSREDLVGQLHTFSEGQGGILGLLEGMDQGDTGSRTEMADQAVDVVGNQGGGAGTPQPVMPGGVMPGVGLEVGGAGPQGGQGALGQASGLGAIPPLTEPLDQRHQRISLLLQGHGLQPDDADQMSTLLNPHIKGHTTRWSEDEQLWENVWAKGTEDRQFEQDIAYDPTINVVPGGDTAGRVGTEAQAMRLKAGLGGTTGSQAVGVVRGEVVGDKSLLETQGGDVTTGQINRALSQYVPGSGSQGVTSFSRDWAPSPEYGTSPGQPGYVAPDEILGDEAWSTPSRPDSLVGGGLDITRQTTPGLRTGVEPGVIQVGAKNSAGDTWDGTQWVKPEADIDKSAVDVGATYTDAAGNEQLVSEAVLHPFFEGWKPADQTMVPGGPAPGTQYVTSPEFPGVVFPSEKLMNDFMNLQNQAGEIYTHHTDSGKRRRDFVGWSAGYGSTPQFEDVVAVEKGGKTYYFTNNVDAQFFHDYGGFPKGDWADGWGPGSGKPMPPGWEVSKDTKGKDTWTKPPGKEKPFITGDALPKGAVEGPMGDITWNGVYIGYRDSSTGSIVWDEAFLASQEESAGGYTGGEGETYEYDVSGGVTGLGDGTGVGAAGGGDEFAGLLGDLQPKPQFDPAAVDSRKYPDLAEFINSITTAGSTSEAITGTIINAIKEMETIKAQEGENQFQRMMQTSIAELDRRAVSDRATLDRELQQGVALGKVAEKATLAAEMENNAQLMREYQLSGMMPAKWQADPEAPGAGVKTLAREEMEVRQTQAEAATTTAAATETSIANQRERDLSELFGKYIGADTTIDVQTLEAQKWGFTKTMQEAEVSGMVWSDVAGVTETMSLKRLTFEKDVAAQKNNWETQRISNEQTAIQNDYNINQQSIASTQMIEQNKLSEAVAARKAKNELERDKMQITKNTLKIETLLSLAEPATFLFATRFGLLDNLGIALGVDFSDEMYPGEIPLMLEPGTIPTMQQLRAATPAERQIMLAEMASSGGYSMDEALSRVQAGTPGGRRIQRESLAGRTR